MAKYRKVNIFRNHVLPVLPWVVVGAVVIVVAWFFFHGDGKNTPPTPEVLEEVYVCNGCGKEYIGSFPYTPPWAECPTEFPAHEIVDVEETYRNGSISGATPVAAFQRVTGNLSSREDKDFYSFTMDVPGKMYFNFTYDGSRRGYTYLWEGTIYGPDGKTGLKAGGIPSKDGEETTFGVSDLEPGTYYLKISAASGGNPLLNGYSDADYHITFLTSCAQHTCVTQVLTQAPTCSQAGELTAVCDVCSTLVSTEVLAPLEHIWSKWRTVKEISLSSPLGECSRICALCGDVETDALLLHLLDKSPQTDSNGSPTTDSQVTSCVSANFGETLCPVCGSVTVENMGAVEHTYGEWVTDRPATCSVEGQRSRVCTACGNVETEPLACLPHSYGETVQMRGSIWDAPIVSRQTCTECGYVNVVESGWSRWVLPVIVAAGAAAAAAALVLIVWVIRRQHRRAAQKRREKTFLCPYCFHTSRIRDVQFRCTNRLCKDVPDQEMTRYEHGAGIPKIGKPTFEGRTIKWVRGMPHSAVCPVCKHTSYKVICPACHNPLPESTLTGEDMIISVVGSRDTGKTHFIAVIINELIERIAPAFDGSFEGFDDTMNRYEDGFKKQLYGKLLRFGMTESSLVDVDNGAYRPLIFTLKRRTKGFLKEKIRSYTLVFFDCAGEDLKSEETMNTVNRYIGKSAGIIFLLDPLKIPTVAAQLDKRVMEHASAVRVHQSDDILGRVSNLVRNDQGLRGNDKIKIPVSVVFSKFDTIEPIIPRGCTILEPSPHCAEGVFDLSDCHNVNTEVQGLLRTWGAESFLSQLKLNYTSYSCFAVSSLGMNNDPNGGGAISRPHPHRIEDPLLWLLMKRKVIKARK